MPALQKKLLVAIAIALLLQASVNLIKYFLEVADGARFGGDFVVMSDTATALGQDNFHAIYDTAKLDAVFKAYPPEEIPKVVGPFLYPPHALFLLWPIRNLSYNEAVALWSFLPLPFYFLFLLILARHTIPYTALAPAVITCACALPFLCANIFTGQTAAFFSLLFMGTVLSWRRRPIIAGICIGLMTFKPQLGLLIPLALIASRQWKIMLVAGCTAILVTGAATLWLGIDIWVDYLQITSRFMEYLKNGIDQFDKLALGPYVSLHMLGISSSLAFIVQVIITLVIALNIMRIFSYRDERRQDLRFGLLACGGLLATPYAMSYDTPLLAVAIAPLLMRAWKKGWRNIGELVVLAMVLGIPFAQPLLLPYHVPFGFLSLLGLFVVMWRRYAVYRA